MAALLSAALEFQRTITSSSRDSGASFLSRLRTPVHTYKIIFKFAGGPHSSLSRRVAALLQNGDAHIRRNAGGSKWPLVLDGFTDSWSVRSTTATETPMTSPAESRTG